MRILVIEDERKVASALKEGLERDSFSVNIAHTGEDGFYLLSTEDFDLVILDLMLPGRSGFQILETIRNQGSSIPVLILTAKDSVEDRVRGLDAGADDYLLKPFAFAELTARLRALLRRTREVPNSLLRFQGLEINTANRTVTRDNRTLDLTVREYEILEYLMRHQGEVVSREMLANDVWKEPSRPTPLDNVIDVHMVRLRRKVDDGFEARLLHTVRGVGFTLRKEKA